MVLFRELLRDPGTKRVGTRGQKQHGLDIIGLRDRDPNQIVGIQCKLKSGRSKLTKKEVRDEIKKALRYKPLLSEYFIVTTSKDDAVLLPIAQQAMQQQQTAGRLVHIEIWGWDTLQQQIDQHESASFTRHASGELPGGEHRPNIGNESKIAAQLTPCCARKTARGASRLWGFGALHIPLR